jgi:hypothetical protein
MKAHELARILLAGPDVVVSVGTGYWGEAKEVEYYEANKHIDSPHVKIENKMPD